MTGRTSTTNLIAWCVLAAAGVYAGTAQAGTVPDQFYLGTNLAGISDWGTEPVWKDIMKQSRSWCPQRPGANWGDGWPLAVDSLNWVTSLDADQTADSPLFGSTSNGWTSMHPDSTYICTYEGTGRVTFWNAQSYSEVSTGRLELRAKSGSAPFLNLVETDPADYVRNIRICLPSHEGELDTEPWHQDFLDRWSPFGVVRFMDWGATNNSPVRHWSERTRPNSQTQAMASGVALEHMIDYCNRTNSDPWFCMPHMADDDFVRNFATMVRDDLNPWLTIYVEYSNEIWNSIFEQTHYCDSVGSAQGLDPSGTHPWEAGWRYSGRRSGQIFDIWEDVFGGTDRFVRVIASQMNTYVAARKLEQDDVHLKTDALAIAPYFGGHLSGDRLGEIESWTVDQILDSCLAHIRGGVRDGIQSFIDLLDDMNAQHSTNMKLIAYEGGQHLSAWNRNQTVTDLFTAANRDPRMKDLYIEYFEQWQELGGKMFANFSSVGSPGPYGAWGVLESVDQDPLDAPKYQALLELIQRYPAPTTTAPRRSTGARVARLALGASPVGRRFEVTPTSDSRIRLLRPNGAVVDMIDAGAGRTSAVGAALAPGAYVLEARAADGARACVRRVLR
ncbi:MAG: hypothetical protein GF331_07095 [Chitinivibrionales bacterium]|nr:hypothetical protein [Chitinivibrionales bacterium]